VFFFLISLALLVGASSSTALINFVIFVVCTLSFLVLSSVFRRVGLGKFVSLFSISTTLVIFLLLYTQAPEVISSLDVTGKDVTTFSERTFLWEYIQLEIAKHPILGCGFRGFWVVDSPGMEEIQRIFPFMPIQAHSGYLDITNEVGIIGLILFLFIFLQYFKEIKKIGHQGVWVWFLLLPIVGNITETTLFREGSITQVFFNLAYLIPFVFREEGENA
jgi:O-antigen ligase